MSEEHSPTMGRRTALRKGTAVAVGAASFGVISQSASATRATDDVYEYEVTTHTGRPGYFNGSWVVVIDDLDPASDATAKFEGSGADSFTVEAGADGEFVSPYIRKVRAYDSLVRVDVEQPGITSTRDFEFSGYGDYSVTIDDGQEERVAASGTLVADSATHTLSGAMTEITVRSYITATVDQGD